MKSSTLLFLVLSAIDIVYSATPCKKDNCYSAVASGGKSSPNFSSRRSDCSSFLRTVLQDQKTITQTTTITPATATTTITDATVTEIQTVTDSNSRRRRANKDSHVNILEDRDTYLVQTRKPSYASQCTNLRDYATACLCWGVQPEMIRSASTTIIRMVTITGSTLTSNIFATDTVTTTTTKASVPTFTCPVEGYMVAVPPSSGTPSLYSVDVSTGQRTLIKVLTETSVNAIGYNALDNILYGVSNNSPTSIIQIGSTGEISTLRQIPNAPGAYNAGDVDENGSFWIAYQGRNWVQIDLATISILASGTASPPLAIYDWAFVPGGGNFLYAIGVDSTGLTFLYAFNRLTHEWKQVGPGYGQIYPNYGVVGAVYASQDGFLYGSENTGGKIYKFSLDGQTSLYISTGPTASSNDGAHCILNDAS